MSDALDFLRSRSPRLREVDDDTLTQFAAERYPVLLEKDPALSERYQSLMGEQSLTPEDPRLQRQADLQAQMKAARTPSAGDRFMQGVGAVGGALETTENVLQDWTVKPLGAALNELSNVGRGVARDVRLGNFSSYPNINAALSGRDLGPSPGGIPGTILDEVGATLPLIATAELAAPALASAVGGAAVPVAFGGQSFAQSLAATDDPVQAYQAGALGLILPAAGIVGTKAAGQLLARLGSMEGATIAPAVAKSVEFGASQTAQNATALVADSQEFARLYREDPEKAYAHAAEFIGMNLALGAKDLLNIPAGNVPSAMEMARAVREHVPDLLRQHADARARMEADPRVSGRPGERLPQRAERAGIESAPPELVIEPPVIKESLTTEPAAQPPPPSPPVAMPEKPSQTITGSKVQTGTEMPVRPAAQAKAGEAPGAGLDSVQLSSLPTAAVVARLRAAGVETPRTDKEEASRRRARPPKSSEEQEGAMNRWRDAVFNDLDAHERRASSPPAAAVAKVKEHVKDVVSGAKPIPPEFAPARHPLAVEGEKLKARNEAKAATARASAAKEIKSELVERLEKAIEAAPEAFDHNERENRTVTIEIPGDGTFTIRNDKQSLGEVLKRAKKVSTSSAPQKNFTESGISKADREWVQEQLAAQKPAEAPASINTGAIGEVGMGGAKPGEFRAGASPTSIKNATVDAERQQRGLPPAMEPARRSFDQVWDEAMARVDQDPAYQDRLIADLKERPRALTDLEDALLLHRQVDLQNEYGRLTRDLAMAYDDAKTFPNRLEAVEELKVRVREISDKLLELYDLNKRVGTETGRGLNARKMMAQEDFTLASMELQLRAAKDGAPLTDRERAEVTRLQEKIGTVQKAFDDYVAKADAEKAQRAADETVRALREQVAKEPTYEPEIASLAERIVNRLEREADAARIRIKARLARTSAGIDPSLLYDLSVVGASHIARGALDLGRFTTRMVAEFGEDIRGMIPDIWNASQQKLDREVAGVAGAKTPTVRRAVRQQDVGEQRTRILDGLAEAVKEDRPLQELGDYVRKLATNFVRSGITAREPLIDAVHGELVKLLPDITRRQTMDAISGYGQFKPLDPNAIKATLRDLRGQMQQVAKLEDITARQPALKTGVERRTPSNEERRLIAQVNEAKRRFGVVSTDPARQLKGALDTTKTRLRNQIADLTFQISTKEKIVRTKTPPPVDAEVLAMKAERDILRQQFDEIFQKPGLSDEQRIAMATRALELNIQTYEARLASKDYTNLRGQARVLVSAKLDALRARRDALRAEFENLRAALNSTPEAQLANYKARLLARTAEYQDRLARGDFEPPKRHDLRLDREALRLKAIAERVKGDWQHEVIKARLAQRTRMEKLLDVPRELIAAQRQLWTSFDLSSVFRQGGILSGSHPIVAARAGALMLRALSTRQAEIHWQSLLDRPNARDGSYHAAKLFLSDPNRTTPSAVEENLRARWLHKFPGIKQSNQTYVTYLNDLRASSFDILKSGLEARGTPLNTAELRGVANYINIATGRGDLGRFAAAADVLSMGFFAPRLVVSRFQYLLGMPLYGKAGSWRVRRALAQEYARSLGMLGVVIGLGLLAGATVEYDPRSSDFGKFKFGNTRLDMMSGLQQATVFLARNITRENKNRQGEIKSLVGPRSPGAMGLGDVWINFARSKQAPWINTVSEAWTGRDYNGRPVTPLDSALRAVAPLSFRDIGETMREQGIPQGAALSALSLLGAGIGTETDPNDALRLQAIMRRVPPAPPEAREALRLKMEQQLKQTRQQNRP